MCPPGRPRGQVRRRGLHLWSMLFAKCQKKELYAYSKNVKKTLKQ